MALDESDVEDGNGNSEVTVSSEEAETFLENKDELTAVIVAPYENGEIDFEEMDVETYEESTLPTGSNWGGEKAAEYVNSLTSKKAPSDSFEDARDPEKLSPVHEQLNLDIHVFEIDDGKRISYQIEFDVADDDGQKYNVHMRGHEDLDDDKVQREFNEYADKGMFEVRDAYAEQLK